MICPPCRKDNHEFCDNRSIGMQLAGRPVNVAVHDSPEVTKTRCACQHRPRGTLVIRADLTSSTESDTLQS